MPVDFEGRILDKFDTLEVLIRNLCDRTTKMEVQLEDHFKDMDKREARKERKFYYLIALVGVGFTLYQIMKELV
jgi:hypothetical protein